MRPKVARFGFWACCFVGSSTAFSPACPSDRIFVLPDEQAQTTAANVVVTVADVSPTLSSIISMPLEYNTTFEFDASSVNITAVRLRAYSVNGAADGSDDELLGSTTLGKSTPTLPVDEPTFPSGERAFSRGLNGESDILQQGLNSSDVVLVWSTFFAQKSSHTHQPLYLECDWMNSTTSGTSTTQLFQVDCFNGNIVQFVPRQAGSSELQPLPARAEVVEPLAIPPTEVSQPTAGASSSATQPQPTTAPKTSTTHGGLSKGGIIGVAVGATLGGLIIIGLLLWFFYFRRRRANRAMPIYDSDVAMTRKELPVAAEASVPPSGNEAEAQPIIAPYPQYSDHETPQPTTPLHRTTEEVEPATSQTDLPSTISRSVPSTAPVISPRYAHLVEEGMSDEEIRRLEEEEQQLDAEIENAGRRANANANAHD